MSVIPEQPRRRSAGDINIVPLVDVLIVLIFFFLISMQFRNMTVMNLVLPKIETAGKSKPVEQIEIAISPEGRLFFNGVEMPRSAFEEAVALAAAGRRDVPVLLLADEESSLKHVTYVMDVVRGEGLDRIRLQSR